MAGFNTVQYDIFIIRLELTFWTKLHSLVAIAYTLERYGLGLPYCL